jgi:sugar transferase (PEP-CTERM/EpsH1 system associated)
MHKSVPTSFLPRRPELNLRAERTKPFGLNSTPIRLDLAPQGLGPFSAGTLSPRPKDETRNELTADCTKPILYLITELSTGGAQAALLRLLKGLDRRRYTPTVACLYNGDGAVAREIRALSIPVFDAQMRHKADLPALLRLYRHIRRSRPTILHTSLFHANLSGRVLGRLAGVPTVICSERTMAMEDAWRYRVNRWTIGLADRVIAVSANVRDFCVSHIGLPADKLVVIYNGVELPEEPTSSRQEARAELGLPGDGPVVGTVSRLNPVKGVDFLIQALAQMDDVTLVIIGDGPERAALEVLAGDLGVAGRIHWAGHRRDVPHLLPALDVFVQPSLHEGLPNTVLEAMAAGLPVVATAVGGTPEVVVDGLTGVLVPPRDSSALAGAVAMLLSDQNLRHGMGQAGRERVAKHFAARRMIEQTERLYEQLLSERKAV